MFFLGKACQVEHWKHGEHKFHCSFLEIVSKGPQSTTVVMGRDENGNPCTVTGSVGTTASQTAQAMLKNFAVSSLRDLHMTFSHDNKTWDYISFVTTFVFDLFMDSFMKQEVCNNFYYIVFVNFKISYTSF